MVKKKGTIKKRPKPLRVKHTRKQKKGSAAKKIQPTKKTKKHLAKKKHFLSAKKGQKHKTGHVGSNKRKRVETITSFFC